ncbi:MAG: hypothetical protein P0Y55_11005 [Candidatus Cohnella colombiensis]|uniref:Uncharacterized protein n=1 Tax=Candidatus Cohnella colombiensis TaxID=3121368 RepID=A0AA95J9D3_9BACL|nr:MAG: hypothetical protein P0Y55_11005 [Cohnella sp.]
MRENMDVLTNNYLKFCYTCDEAHQCQNERDCIACWQEKGLLLQAEVEQETTEAFLREYAL